MVILGLSPRMGAQARPESVLSEYETVNVGPGVYAFIAPESKTGIVSGNSLVVIGSTGVLVVDSTNVPSLTKKMIADIKRWTDRPVRFLVNTHWHFDHVMGNAAYREAFPDITVIATEGMRQAADVQVPAYFEQMVGPAASRTSEALRSMLTNGKRPDGSAMTEGDRAFYALELADYDAWTADVRGTPYVRPTVTFDREMTVDLGSRSVRLQFLGRGNTAGDAVVYVPDAKVIATGDLLVGPTPYASGSFLREWIGTLDALKHFDATTIVPGHGPVEHDWQHTDAVQTLLRAVVDQVDRCVARGLNLDDTRRQIDVSSLRVKMVGSDPFRARMFDTYFLAPAVDRAFRDASYRAEK